ncbi:MAG: HAMP domain-containing protein, partial [Bacteroidota bacterium]
LNFYFVVDEAISWQRLRRQEAPTLHTGKRIAAVLVALLLGLGFQWIVRGFGAALRSFVFDSTLQYQDPASIIPDASVFVMHLNILLLMLSLLIACVTMILLIRSLVAFALQRGGQSQWLSVVVFGVLLGAYGMFLLVNKIPQTPIYYPILTFVVSIFIASWFRPQTEGQTQWRHLSLRRVVILGAVAFALSSLLLDVWQHEKERQRVQVLADELLRPVDNWLSFVISEGLRSAVVGAGEGLSQNNADYMNTSNLAFLLWAQSLMSREGYNSAVFVYNNQGKETSRFSVGLTTYEQMELLSQVFDTEEEVLHVVERKVQGGTIKYYGEWASVLDSHGQQLGTVAVIVSASQRTLFRGEAPEPLRTTSRESFEESFRKLSISEYQSGLLVSTTDHLLFRGLRMPEAVQEELTASTARFLWSEHDRGGQTYDVLYAKDESKGGRILALGMHSLDIRWHLFNLVKMLAVYMFFFGIATAAHIGQSYLRRGSLKLGFRQKLVSSFAVLSILPLLVMAYYNRELAIERLDDGITRRLAEDLDIIHQRITTSVIEEEDFFSGINNDYCEVAAADLGVDFSVYSGPALQASSRPELYRAAILDSRLTGSAFVNTMMLGKSFFRDLERIGEVRYIVGYRPILLGDRVLGVLAVPALYRQREIDEELAQRNAFVLGAYALVVLFVVIVGFIVASRLSKPLRELSLAAQVIGRGNLDVQLTARSADEVGDLVRSFNEMTKELKVSREHLARVERELAWKEMAKQVAHEIKNPLTPIKLSIQHLIQAYKDGAKDFDQILHRVSNTVIEQIQVLTRIASEFSNFARMPERRFERVDVKQLLQETVTLFGEVRGIEFRSNFSETPAILVADKDELRRVFINIIRNSVQAMDRGGAITVDMGVS